MTSQTIAMTPVVNGNPPKRSPNSPIIHTEVDLAQAFVEKHGSFYRFDGNDWYRWNNGKWNRGAKKFVLQRLLEIAQSATGLKGNSAAIRIMKDSTFNGAARIASLYDCVSISPDAFDKDPMLLGTPEGTVDLKTGKIRPASRKDYITNVTRVAPKAGPKPHFDKFFARLLGDDRDLMAYMQRALGYSCTGSSKEEAVFFLVGVGGEGKSVLLNAISNILGGAAKYGTLDLLSAAKGIRNTADVAMLNGARMVCIPETKKGDVFDEARLKTLSGGANEITARKLYQDHVTFSPTWTVWIAGNYPPDAPDTEAIRRRLKIIKVAPPVAKEDCDTALSEKLMEEAPAILAWLIEGAKLWHENGLGTCAAVEHATATYLEESDHVAQWIQDYCTRGPSCWSPSSELWKAYSPWARDAGFMVNRREFSQSLMAAGFPSMRMGHAATRGFQGLQLK